jgi:hypothetical protein
MSQFSNGLARSVRADEAGWAPVAGVVDRMLDIREIRSGNWVPYIDRAAAVAAD